MRVEVEGTGYVKWKRWEWYKRAVVKVKERLYLISKKYQREFYIYNGMFWIELSTCNLVKECTFALFKLMLWYSLRSRRRRRRRPFYTTYISILWTIVTTWWLKKKRVFINSFSISITKIGLNNWIFFLFYYRILTMLSIYIIYVFTYITLLHRNLEKPWFLVTTTMVQLVLKIPA